jgi:hypothetical protein
MFKILTQSENYELHTNKVPVIKDLDNVTYQLKIIDLGLSVDSKNQKCEGGTPGYVPHEFFSLKSHNKFDVFSIAVVLLDMELAHLGYPNFSNISRKIFYGKSNPTYKKTLLHKDLLNNKLYTELINLLQEEEIMENIITEVSQESIYGKYKNRKNINFNLLLTADIHILEFTLTKLIFILLNKHRKEVMDPERKQIKDDLAITIQDSQKKISPDPKDILNNKTIVTHMQYISAKHAYIELEEKLQTEYYKVLEAALNRDTDKRIDFETLIQTLSVKYENCIKMTKLTSDFIENYEMNETKMERLTQELMFSVASLDDEDVLNRNTVMKKVSSEKSNLYIDIEKRNSFDQFMLI